MHQLTVLTNSAETMVVKFMVVLKFSSWGINLARRIMYLCLKNRENASHTTKTSLTGDG